MIEDKFWELATKYMTNVASEDDINQLFLLIKSDKKYQKAFNETVHLWNAVGIPEIQFNSDSAKEKLLDQISEESIGNQKTYPFSKIVPRIAAVFAVLLGSYFMLQTILNKQEWKEFTTTSDEKLKIVLPDSTFVWLNENSSVAYNYTNPNERILKLDGEAFFDVARNENRPFIIKGEYFKTQVLGTSFNMDLRREREASVSVISGKVVVSANESNIQFLLERGDGAVFSPTTNTLNKQKLLDVDNEIAWIEGEFSFEDSSMQSVLDYLSEYYGVTFIVANQNIKNCLITANFKGESLRNILTVVCASLDCEYEILDNRKIILSGNGCQKKPGDITSIVPAKNQ